MLDMLEHKIYTLSLMYPRAIFRWLGYMNNPEKQAACFVVIAGLELGIGFIHGKIENILYRVIIMGLEFISSCAI
jgi:hypothetical protein